MAVSKDKNYKKEAFFVHVRQHEPRDRLGRYKTSKSDKTDM